MIKTQKVQHINVTFWITDAKLMLKLAGIATKASRVSWYTSNVFDFPSVEWKETRTDRFGCVNETKFEASYTELDPRINITKERCVSYD